MPPAVWSLLQNWECDTSMCLTCLCSPNSMGMTVKLNLGGSRPLAERRNDPFKGQGLTGAPGEGRVVWQVKRPQDPLPGLRGSICAAVRTRPRQAQGRRTPKPCPAPPNLPPRSMAHMSGASSPGNRKWGSAPNRGWREAMGNAVADEQGALPRWVGISHSTCERP